MARVSLLLTTLLTACALGCESGPNGPEARSEPKAIAAAQFEMDFGDPQAAAKALGRLSDSSDPNARAAAQIKLGILCLRKGAFCEARRHWDVAALSVQRREDRIELATLYTSQASMCEASGQLELARECLSKSLSIWSEPGPRVNRRKERLAELDWKLGQPSTTG